MKFNCHKWITLLAMSLLLAALFSCNSLRQLDPRTTATSNVVLTLTQTTVMEEPTEPVVIASSTPTWMISPPSSSTPTPPDTVTPSPSQTWTPAPTLSKAEALALVENLLETNGGCRLPCWWGITPGKTEWNTAKHFLKTFAIRFGQGGEGQILKDGVPVYITNYNVQYESKSGKGGFQVGIEDSIVISVKSGLDPIQDNFYLGPLLAEYGIPDEVFIRTATVTSTGDPPPFNMLLDYRNQGFWVKYELEGEVSTEQVIGCPQGINPVLYLFSPERKWTDDQMFSATFGPPVPDAPKRPTLTLKDATGMDSGTFYQIFKEAKNQTCLETPTNLWP